MLDPVTKNFLDLIADGRDNEACRLLYVHYQATLLDFATAYLKSRPPAEEIVNDVLYRVWLMKENIVEISNLRAYLFTAVRNASLSLLAKIKKEQHLLSGLPFKDLTTDDPESLAISMELYDCIRNAINALPPRCRQVYEMVRVEGMRNKDVAEKLQLSVNTVDVQLAIAVKKLVQAVSAFNQVNKFSSKI
jgi:RNA polymerase sigma-70 factor (ECF subfamily)